MTASIFPFLVAMFVLTADVHAQSAIRKCVGADGKIHYQDTPCEPGKKPAGEVQRNTTPADPTALRRAQGERELSNRLTRAREKQNAAEETRRGAADSAGNTPVELWNGFTDGASGKAAAPPQSVAPITCVGNDCPRK
jgi:hypothetical protein